MEAYIQRLKDLESLAMSYSGVTKAYAYQATPGALFYRRSLAKKYLGKDTYPFRQPGEVRVMYEIEPTAASGMG